MQSARNVIVEENSYLLLNKTPKKIKASFAGCPVSDRKLFANSSCILPISIVGSKDHEGKRFAAAMELINASFKSCTLLIVDSLYRHTLKIDFPEQDNTTLYNRSMQAGDDWLDRNKDSYAKIDIPCKIIRWNYYLQHPNFQEQLNMVVNLYNSDAQYRREINANIEQYLERHLNNQLIDNGRYKNAFDYCKDYLQEECASMCLWVEGEYNFEVYPTGRCLALDATYKHCIQSGFSDLLKPVALRFKKSSVIGI